MDGFNRDGPRRDNRGPRRNNSRDGGRDGGFSGRNDRGPRRSFGGPKEMHKAVCAECGEECEVPFKPSGDRPVYCRDCFNKNKSY